MKLPCTFKLCALTALLIAMNIHSSPAQNSNDNWLEGIWEGTGQQSGGQSWKMRVTVSGNTYQIEYPSLGCSGVWNLVEINSKKAKFVERVSNNRVCMDAGNVSIERVNDERIKFSYSAQNSKQTIATAILQKSRATQTIETKQNSNSIQNDNGGGHRTGQRRGAPITTSPPTDWDEKKRNGTTYRQQLFSTGYNIGKLLKETNSFKLYGRYRPLSNLPEFFVDWCANESNWAALSLIFKADAKYQIDNNAAYWSLFEQEMFPEVLAQCPSLDQVFIVNYVDGYQIEYGLQEVVWNPQPNRETNEGSDGLSISVFLPNSTGDSKYRWFYGQGGTGNLEQIMGLVRQGREPRIYGERMKERDDKSITSVARLQELWKDAIAKREEERRLKAEEEKQRLLLAQERKRETHRARASTILGLYKRGGGLRYDFTGYDQKENLENIYSGSFERFTGGYESNELEKQQLNYLGILLGGGSIDSAFARVNEQLARTKDVVSRRLPIMIAYFAYHQAYEKQCYPNNNELPWIKGSYRTDVIYSRGAFVVNRIEGQTYVFYVREPFFKAFDNTYRAAQEGQLVQFLTGVPLSTRTSYENDFLKFLQKEGCASSKTRSLEVNLYLASEWLLPLQELLPAELLQPLPIPPARTVSSSPQKTPTQKTSTTKKPLKKKSE